LVDCLIKLSVFLDLLLVVLNGVIWLGNELGNFLLFLQQIRVFIVDVQDTLDYFQVVFNNTLDILIDFLD
jgi:hypothetical protein